LPGDAVFIFGGALPVLYLCWLGIRHLGASRPSEEAKEILFTEVATTSSQAI